MRAKSFYELRSEDGAAVDGRIVKAVSLLLRHGRPGSRFLDVGCGAGEATAFIATAIKADRTCGVDIAERNAAAASSRGVDAAVVDIDQQELPYPDGSFDAVHCGEVLEHVLDTDHLLSEIRRVMAPSAVCVLSTPNLAAWHNRIALAAGYQPFLTHVSFRTAPGRPFFARANAGGGHLRVFTHRALREFVCEHGFEIAADVGVGMFEIGDPPGSRVMKALAVPLDRIFTSVSSLATANMLALRRNEASGR